MRQGSTVAQLTAQSRLVDRAVNPKLVQNFNRAEKEQMSAIVAEKEATEMVAEGLWAVHQIVARF